ncbi:MAG: vanadium-dependent haloperoxidase [Caldimonas sp.]
MKLSRHLRQAATAVACAAGILGACGGGDDGVDPVTIDAGTPNTVSRWDETATATINQANAASGTAEEMQSNYAFDLATVHIAMYDAVIAIAGGHAAFYASPASPAAGASEDAAAAAAAYGVLKGLFPSRIATYQPLYDSSLAAVTDTAARSKGVALGTEVAVTVLAARSSDGRSIVLAPFVAGSGPGQFRGPAIVGRTYSNVRPFALTAANQFRAPGPPALTSAAYVADFNETVSLGSSTSTTRTADQATIARFHSEAPSAFWPRNLRPFTMTSRSLADQARLGALLWVTHADATIGCFESKYALLAWRPFSAINFADTDGNAATAVDPAWTPFLPTPPHPEYPAAHACVSGATAKALRSFYGTSEVSFDFTSNASASTHHYASTEALVDDITIARIAGGMHFRSAIVDGAVLGRSVADWTVQHRFGAR